MPLRNPMRRLWAGPAICLLLVVANGVSYALAPGWVLVAGLVMAAAALGWCSALAVATRDLIAGGGR